MPPQGAPIAFLGLNFVDKSHEGALNGVRQDEVDRLVTTNAYLKDDLTKRGFSMLAIDAVQDQIDDVKNTAKCNGCAEKMARQLGAEYVLVGEVIKVSNLVISMTMVMNEAETGKTVAMGVVDIRGNSDMSWQRGISYIIRHRFLGE